jgi:hypothetical protein
MGKVKNIMACLLFPVMAGCGESQKDFPVSVRIGNQQESGAASVRFVPLDERLMSIDRLSVRKDDVGLRLEPGRYEVWMSVDGRTPVKATSGVRDNGAAGEQERRTFLGEVEVRPSRNNRFEIDLVRLTVARELAALCD